MALLKRFGLSLVAAQSKVNNRISSYALTNRKNSQHHSIHSETSYKYEQKTVQSNGLFITTGNHRFVGVRGFTTESYNDDGNSTYIKLRGLPFNTTEQHIIDFFGDISVEGEANGVKLMANRNSVYRGTAYVQLSKASDLGKALNLDKQNITPERYVEVSESSAKDFSEDVRDSHHQPISSKTGHSVHLVKMLKATTQEDICNFFAPLKPVAVTIRSVRGQRFKSYKGYVDFSTHQDACNAMEKNQQSMGSMVMDLKLVSYDGTCTAYSHTPEPAAMGTAQGSE